MQGGGWVIREGCLLQTVTPFGSLGDLQVHGISLAMCAPTCPYINPIHHPNIKPTNLKHHP